MAEPIKPWDVVDLTQPQAIGLVPPERYGWRKLNSVAGPSRTWERPDGTWFDFPEGQPEMIPVDLKTGQPLTLASIDLARFNRTIERVPPEPQMDEQGRLKQDGFDKIKVELARDAYASIIWAERERIITAMAPELDRAYGGKTQGDWILNQLAALIRALPVFEKEDKA